MGLICKSLYLTPMVDASPVFTSGNSIVYCMEISSSRVG